MLTRLRVWIELVPSSLIGKFSVVFGWRRDGGRADGVHTPNAAKNIDNMTSFLLSRVRRFHAVIKPLSLIWFHNPRLHCQRDVSISPVFNNKNPQPLPSFKEFTLTVSPVSISSLSRLGFIPLFRPRYHHHLLSLALKTFVTLLVHNFESPNFVCTNST